MPATPSDTIGSIADAVSIIAALVTAAARAIAAGATRTTMLAHVKRIADTAAALERDVDDMAAGR